MNTIGPAPSWASQPQSKAAAEGGAPAAAPEGWHAVSRARTAPAGVETFGLATHPQAASANPAAAGAPSQAPSRQQAIDAWNALTSFKPKVTPYFYPSNAVAPKDWKPADSSMYVNAVNGRPSPEQVELWKGTWGGSANLAALLPIEPAGPRVSGGNKK